MTLEITFKSFADPQTQKFWEPDKNKGRPRGNLRRAALRKPLMIDSAGGLDDLRAPPGKRLEELRGDRKGQHSIRMNEQFRIGFVWKDGNA